MKKITITWDGPYSLEQLESGYKHLDSYGGLYQIYGTHPVYGSNVLLYIGKAVSQSFSKRIKQEEHWWDNPDSYNIQVYTGRLFNKVQKKAQEKSDWIDDISLAEQLLINTHMPAHNSSNINSISRKEDILEKISKVRVINWHYYRDLMPEVSGDILLDETNIYNDDDILEFTNITTLKTK
jgi:hypothetical protein